MGIKLTAVRLLAVLIVGLIALPPQESNAGNSLSELEARARSGDSEAQLNLGVMYFHGWGAQANAAYAKYWFEKAAKNGHNKANYYLGRQELLSITSVPSKAPQQATTTQPEPQAAVTQQVPPAVQQPSYQEQSTQPQAPQSVQRALVTQQSPSEPPQPSYQEQSTQSQFVTSGDSDAYDLRGIKLGMSLGEFRAFPFPDKNPQNPTRVFCTGDQAPKGSSISHAVFEEDKAIGLIECNYYEYKPMYDSDDAPKRWDDLNLSVANVPAFMEYSFIPDPNFSDTPRLFKIRAYYNVKAWHKFWSGYKGKYGQPNDIDKTPVQNGVGAKFDNVIAVWKNEESSITLHKRLGEINISYIFYSHTDLAAHVGRMREQVTGKPRDNL